MRCLALAQAWQRSGGSAVFAAAEMTDALEARLAREQFQCMRLAVTPGTIEDAATSAELARSQNASWVIADSYCFGLDFQRVITKAGLRLLIVDDYGHSDEYAADLILNQNLTADADLYVRCAPHTRLLMGTRYALLRQEYLHWRDWQREIFPVARKVLVTLGGSDPDNVTGKVMRNLAGFADLETVVVVGGSNPHLAELQHEFLDSKSAIRWVVDATNMPELMAWADVAIAAGGSTSWELAFMGLPSLALVLAENQREVATALDAANAARQTSVERLTSDLADLLSNDELRRALSRVGRRLVDGYGVNRVITCFHTTSLELRRVRSEDCQLIWEWANEPQARAVSLSSAAIPWEAHRKWFDERLSSPICLFFFATNSHKMPVGQIRFDLNEGDAVVSVSLAKETRGHGYGAALIRLGSEQCFADAGINLIRAYIKPDNEASERAFLKAGFTSDGTVEMAGIIMKQFVMLREWIL